MMVLDRLFSALDFGRRMVGSASCVLFGTHQWHREDKVHGRKGDVVLVQRRRTCTRCERVQVWRSYKPCGWIDYDPEWMLF